VSVGILRIGGKSQRKREGTWSSLYRLCRGGRKGSLLYSYVGGGTETFTRPEISIEEKNSSSLSLEKKEKKGNSLLSPHQEEWGGKRTIEGEGGTVLSSPSGTGKEGASLSSSAARVCGSLFFSRNLYTYSFSSPILEIELEGNPAVLIPLGGGVPV